MPQTYTYVNPTPTMVPYQMTPYTTTNTPMAYPQDMYATGQVYMPTGYPVINQPHSFLNSKTGPVTTTQQIQYPTQMQFPTVYGYGYQPGNYNPGNYNPNQ